MDMKKHLFHVLAGMAAIAGFNAVAMLLWNWLMPSVFGLAAVNFWQMLGLLVLLAGLSKFLVVAAFLGMRGYKRNPIHEKWAKMTPEERREFIKNRRFGHDA
jgi:ABC-type multidrug transport system fused ATPase/permease subunit